MEHDYLEHRIVNLKSRYAPSENDKKRYQCADVVNHIIHFETSIESECQKIIALIETAENSGYVSQELDNLKSDTKAYVEKLSMIMSSIEGICNELVERALNGHGLTLNVRGDFNVSGYNFTAIPSGEEMNRIISDLFSYSDISNINMPLLDVEVTGDKKLRKTQIPSILMMDLWDNFSG